MSNLAVAWEAQAPPEFGGGTVWAVTEEACRRAEADRDRYREALEGIRDEHRDIPALVQFIDSHLDCWMT